MQVNNMCNENKVFTLARVNEANMIFTEFIWVPCLATDSIAMDMSHKNYWMQDLCQLTSAKIQGHEHFQTCNNNMTGIA